MVICRVLSIYVCACVQKAATGGQDHRQWASKVLGYRTKVEYCFVDIVVSRKEVEKICEGKRCSCLQKEVT